MITDSLQMIDLMAYCIRQKLKWIMVTQFIATESFAHSNYVQVFTILLVSVQTKEVGFHSCETYRNMV